jgi:hypothetical protein
MVFFAALIWVGCRRPQITSPTRMATHTNNISANDRVALSVMDYLRGQRLKADGTLPWVLLIRSVRIVRS